MDKTCLLFYDVHHPGVLLVTGYVTAIPRIGEWVALKGDEAPWMVVHVIHDVYRSSDSTTVVRALMERS